MRQKSNGTTAEKGRVNSSRHSNRSPLGALVVRDGSGWWTVVAAGAVLVLAALLWREAPEAAEAARRRRTGGAFVRVGGSSSQFVTRSNEAGRGSKEGRPQGSPLQGTPVGQNAERIGFVSGGVDAESLGAGEVGRVVYAAASGGEGDFAADDFAGDVFAGDDFAGDAAEELATVELDEYTRFGRTVRPDTPEAQRPPLSNEKNVDTGRPVREWQRATDDWFGARPWLDDRGISFQANLTADGSKNLRGGANTEGSAFRHLFNANVTLDTERLVRWPGGTVFLNFQNHHGEDGSADVGDLQGISGIDADGRTQISELWYEQVLWEGKVRIKGGKIDANGEFAAPENGGEFLNSSFGVTPTILGMPTYPDPSFGAVVLVRPRGNVYVGVGVFDGAGQEGVPTGSRGPRTLLDDPSDLFLIGEAGVEWTLSAGRGGRLAAGAWRHTGTFERFDGGNESGTSGPYVLLEQTLWRENPGDDTDGQGVGAFFQYGYAEESVSPIDHHAGIGAAWTGALPTRDDDVFGVGVTWVHLSDDAADFDETHETTAEVFYKFMVTKWFSLKADVQYVRNPGGVASRRDAVVGTVRAVIDF